MTEQRTKITQVYLMNVAKQSWEVVNLPKAILTEYYFHYISQWYIVDFVVCHYPTPLRTIISLSS